jgi:hypothetical protein
VEHVLGDGLARVVEKVVGLVAEHGYDGINHWKKMVNVGALETDITGFRWPRVWLFYRPFCRLSLSWV